MNTTFTCSICSAQTGAIKVTKHKNSCSYSMEAFGMKISGALPPADYKQVLASLNKKDPALLYRLDPALMLFYCPACDSVYCADH